MLKCLQKFIVSFAQSTHVINANVINLACSRSLSYSLNQRVQVGLKEHNNLRKIDLLKKLLVPQVQHIKVPLFHQSIDKQIFDKNFEVFQKHSILNKKIIDVNFIEFLFEPFEHKMLLQRKRIRVWSFSSFFHVFIKGYQMRIVYHFFFHVLTFGVLLGQKVAKGRLSHPDVSHDCSYKLTFWSTSFCIIIYRGF